MKYIFLISRIINRNKAYTEISNLGTTRMRNFLSHSAYKISELCCVPL